MTKPISERSEVCTTQKAAEILGISVSSVQQLVEAGAIEAWKTTGGHRRIPLQAVLAYKRTHSPFPPSYIAGPKSNWPPAELARVLIVEDNPMQRELYRQQITGWQLDCELIFCDNGYMALLEIARRQPEILLVDIVMEGLDGYELINTVIADPHSKHMHIAILSGLDPESLHGRGGVPAGTVFFNKPINYDQLQGYLKACCAHFIRSNQRF